MTPSRMYLFIRSKQLEGTFDLGPKVGSHLITALRILKGWGGPPEEAWPYNGKAEDWPHEEPAGIDDLAKQYRIGPYQRVRSLEEIRVLISSGLVVTISVHHDESWFDASNGVIPWSSNSPIGSMLHAVVLVGYNHDDHLFIFRNSWGTNWGDNGHGYMSYDYFVANCVEAWYIVNVLESLPLQKIAGNQIINYGITDQLGGLLHVIEIVDAINDFRIAWSFGTIRDSKMEIDELFVHPDFRFRGYGSFIFNEWKKICKELKLQPIFWISDADADRDNLYVIDKIAKKINMERKHVEEGFADYVIEEFSVNEQNA